MSLNVIIIFPRFQDQDEATYLEKDSALMLDVLVQGGSARCCGVTVHHFYLVRGVLFCLNDLPVELTQSFQYVKKSTDTLHTANAALNCQS